MKILVLVNSCINIFDNNFIGLCKTRSEFLANQFVNQIKKNYKHIKIDICKCYTNQSRQTFYINNFENVDHIIYFNDIGLYSTQYNKSVLEFIEKIRSKCSTLSCVAKGYKYKTVEDFLFRYSDAKTLYTDSTFIDFVLDPLIYQPIKDKNTLYILFQKPELCLTKKICYTITNILSQFQNLEMDLELNLTFGLLNQTSLEIIDINQSFHNLVLKFHFHNVHVPLFDINNKNNQMDRLLIMVED